MSSNVVARRVGRHPVEHLADAAENLAHAGRGVKLMLIPDHVGDKFTLKREQLQILIDALERTADATHHAVQMFKNGAQCFDREAANIDTSIATIARVLKDARPK